MPRSYLPSALATWSLLPDALINVFAHAKAKCLVRAGQMQQLLPRLMQVAVPKLGCQATTGIPGPPDAGPHPSVSAIVEPASTCDVCQLPGNGIPSPETTRPKMPARYHWSLQRLEPERRSPPIRGHSAAARKSRLTWDCVVDAAVDPEIFSAVFVGKLPFVVRPKHGLDIVGRVAPLVTRRGPLPRTRVGGVHWS